MKTLPGFALGTFMMLGAATAWAEGNVPAQRASDQAVEVIIVTAKRLPPETIDVVVVTAKRPVASVEAKAPPALPIEMPRLEFAIGGPPVVRL